MHSLGLQVRLQTSLTQLATNTTLLNTTKRHSRVRVIGRVDPDHARLKPLSNLVSALNVLAKDSRGQAVLRVVGELERVLLVLEGGNGYNGTKDFLLENGHFVVDARKDGGLNVEALAAAGALLGRLAAHLDLGALLLGAFDKGQNLVVLGLRYLGPVGGVFGKGVASLGHVLDGDEEVLDEFVDDGLVDKQAGGGGADLALVAEDANVSPLGGLVEVGVVKDEKRRLATSLESNVLHGATGHFHDFAASGSGAGKGNLVDVGVGGEGLASVLAVAVEDVEDARRETSLANEGSKVEDREGSLFSRLENDAVASGQGRTQLPGSHGEREIPWDNLGADTNRLAQGIGKLGPCGRDSLAVELVGPAGVVAEAVDDLFEILVDRDGVRLAVVPGLNGGEDVLVLLYQVGQLVHEDAAVTAGQVTP